MEFLRNWAFEQAKAAAWSYVGNLGPGTIVLGIAGAVLATAILWRMCRSVLSGKALAVCAIGGLIGLALMSDDPLQSSTEAEILGAPRVPTTAFESAEDAPQIVVGDDPAPIPTPYPHYAPPTGFGPVAVPAYPHFAPAHPVPTHAPDRAEAHDPPHSAPVPHAAPAPHAAAPRGHINPLAATSGLFKAVQGLMTPHATAARPPAAGRDATAATGHAKSDSPPAAPSAPTRTAASTSPAPASPAHAESPPIVHRAATAGPRATPPAAIAPTAPRQSPFATASRPPQPAPSGFETFAEYQRRTAAGGARRSEPSSPAPAPTATRHPYAGIGSQPAGAGVRPFETFADYQRRKAGEASGNASYAPTRGHSAPSAPTPGGPAYAAYDVHPPRATVPGQPGLTAAEAAMIPPPDDRPGRRSSYGGGGAGGHQSSDTSGPRSSGMGGPTGGQPSGMSHQAAINHHAEQVMNSWMNNAANHEAMGGGHPAAMPHPMGHVPAAHPAAHHGR